MPDHIQLLLQDKDVVEFVHLLKGRLTPEARRLEPGRALWQRSFYDYALRREESLWDVALYLWQNLVRAGIVDCACDYPWSGSLVWPDWKAMLGAGGDKPSGAGGDKPRPYGLPVKFDPN
jgi:hypothetical protein